MTATATATREKRVKKVFSTHSEVCHIWAQQTQTEGNAGNIYFESESIFSYGHHFEMARFLTVKKESVVLITTDSYSVSTASHLSLVRRAVTHLPCYWVPSFTDHQQNIIYLMNELKDNVDGVKRSRVNLVSRSEGCQRQKEAIKNYVKHFPQAEKKQATRNQVNAVLLNDVFSTEERAQFEVKDATNNARLEVIRAQRRAKQEEREKEALSIWLNGGAVNMWFSAIRLRIKGDNVESSQGAKVTTQEARLLYMAICRQKNIEGQRVGQYTVTRLTDTTLKIGCHNIPIEEVTRIGQELLKEDTI